MDDAKERALTADEMKLICQVLWGSGSAWSILAAQELGINRRTLTRMVSGRPENPPAPFITGMLRERLAERRAKLLADIAAASGILGLD